MSKNRKGFTLIELLVVIAIIALLLAIIVPSLRKAKEQARAVICRSNLKQWGIIWGLYLNDHKSRFPSPYIGQKQGLWVEPLRPYYADGGEEMRVCPAAADDEFLPPGWNSSWQVSTEITPNEKFECSYGINNYVYDYPGDLWGRSESWHWKRADIRGAGRIPFFLDCFRWGGHPRDIDIPFYTLPQTFEEFRDGCLTENEMRRFCLNRHNKTVNVLFLDNAVEKVGLKQLWELKWHREFNTGGFTAVNGRDWPAWMQGM